MVERRLDPAIDEVAAALVRWGHGVAFTGAGVSVDSGIPDFRSPGGFWERFEPMEYASIEAFRRDPHRVWEMVTELQGLLRRARPNAAHSALAQLERLGLLKGIVTQNIDDLHQRAGSRRIVEYHGNGRRLRCLRCEGEAPAAAGVSSGSPPTCVRCGAVMKPDVVFFGEMIPEMAVREAAELVAGCKLMLVVGTSATVAPASAIPRSAKQQGALLVEVNRGPTAISPLCDVALYGGAAQVLSLLHERVEALLGSSP